MRVMVVEDEKRARGLIINLLLLADPQIQIVGECVNGEDGLQAIPEKMPDMVFVDIRMPVMDGLEMIRQAQAQGMRPRFVVVSAYAEFEFPETLWPDFTLEDYHRALEVFAWRDRRFGGRK